MQTLTNISDLHSPAFGNTENGISWHSQSTDNQHLYFYQTISDFTGKEKDSESGYYAFGARYYDCDLSGLFLSVDPMSDKYPNLSPYAYCAWNPIKLVDPDGEEISTHTDEDGNVVAVYNDGDNGVYKHNGDKEKTMAELHTKYSKTNISAGGFLMGETEYWDEFMTHDNKTGKPLKASGRIRFNESWDDIVKKYNAKSIEVGLEATAFLSFPNKLFDIKNKKTISPDGTHTGRLLNGKYATAESAGNYLAGLNGASGTTAIGFPISRNFYMFLAGMLHSSQNSSAVTNMYFGEIPYAGRRIDAGFRDGRKNLHLPLGIPASNK